MSNAFLLIVVLMVGAVTLGLADGALAGNVSMEKVSTGEFKYVVYAVKNKQQFVFAYSAQNVQRVTLTIRDDKGNQLHRDYFNDKEVGRVYDLKKFGNGTYAVEVRTGDFYEKKEISIEAIPALVANVNMLEGKRVEVSYASTTNEPVSIYINDVRGETVYTSTSDLKKFNRIFNLETMPSGEYVIFVGNSEKTIGQVVKIKK